jgi:ribonuclease Z
MAKIKIENTTIEGEAVSGVASALALVELGICLDIGACTKAALKCDTVLITHGHIDHLGAIVQHANIRSMLGGQKTQYIVPSHLVPAIENLFRAWEALQQGETPNYEIVPVDPGQSVPLTGRSGWSVRPFATSHRIPSQGYMLIETRQKLLPELEGRPSEEIGILRRQGVVVTEKKEIIRFAYTGDTRAEVLDNVPELKACEVLIIEATFLGEDHGEEFASKRGHTHLSGIVQRAAEFKNKAVVLVHFSARYENDQIAAEVEKASSQSPVPFHTFI